MPCMRRHSCTGMHATAGAQYLAWARTLVMLIDWRRAPPPLPSQRRLIRLHITCTAPVSAPGTLPSSPVQGVYPTHWPGTSVRCMRTHTHRAISGSRGDPLPR